VLSIENSDGKKDSAEKLPAGFEKQSEANFPALRHNFL
jgi:hypothetical protein